ncbi:MAG: hypothetical protein ACI4XM_00705 [Candidatus Coprovivens sp.]
MSTIAENVDREAVERVLGNSGRTINLGEGTPKNNTGTIDIETLTILAARRPKINSDIYLKMLKEALKDAKKIHEANPSEETLNEVEKVEKLIEIFEKELQRNRTLLDQVEKSKYNLETIIKSINDCLSGIVNAINENNTDLISAAIKTINGYYDDYKRLYEKFYENLLQYSKNNPNSEYNVSIAEINISEETLKIIYRYLVLGKDDDNYYRQLITILSKIVDEEIFDKVATEVENELRVEQESYDNALNEIKNYVIVLIEQYKKDITKLEIRDYVALLDLEIINILSRYPLISSEKKEKLSELGRKELSDNIDNNLLESIKEIKKIKEQIEYIKKFEFTDPTFKEKYAELIDAIKAIEQSEQLKNAQIRVELSELDNKVSFIFENNEEKIIELELVTPEVKEKMDITAATTLLDNKVNELVNSEDSITEEKVKQELQNILNTFNNIPNEIKGNLLKEKIESYNSLSKSSRSGETPENTGETPENTGETPENTGETPENNGETPGNNQEEETKEREKAINFYIETLKEKEELIEKINLINKTIALEINNIPPRVEYIISWENNAMNYNNQIMDKDIDLSKQRAELRKKYKCFVTSLPTIKEIELPKIKFERDYEEFIREYNEKIVEALEEIEELKAGLNNASLERQSEINTKINKLVEYIAALNSVMNRRILIESIEKNIDVVSLLNERRANKKKIREQKKQEQQNQQRQTEQPNQQSQTEQPTQTEPSTQTEPPTQPEQSTEPEIQEKIEIEGVVTKKFALNFNPNRKQKADIETNRILKSVDAIKLTLLTNGLQIKYSETLRNQLRDLKARISLVNKNNARSRTKAQYIDGETQDIAFKDNRELLGKYGDYKLQVRTGEKTKNGNDILFEIDLAENPTEEEKTTYTR